MGYNPPQQLLMGEYLLVHAMLIFTVLMSPNLQLRLQIITGAPLLMMQFSPHLQLETGGYIVVQDTIITVRDLDHTQCTVWMNSQAQLFGV
jgi:hypothetical protein